MKSYTPVSYEDSTCIRIRNDTHDLLFTYCPKKLSIAEFIHRLVIEKYVKKTATTKDDNASQKSKTRVLEQLTAK